MPGPSRPIIREAPKRGAEQPLPGRGIGEVVVAGEPEPAAGARAEPGAVEAAGHRVGVQLPGAAPVGAGEGAQLRGLQPRVDRGVRVPTADQ
ncbi:MAG: hypothetical protein ACK56I_06435, partial [bacterium]